MQLQLTDVKIKKKKSRNSKVTTEKRKIRNQRHFDKNFDLRNCCASYLLSVDTKIDHN